MSFSPLLKVVFNRIIPWVKQYGISKIALAQPTWKSWQTLPNSLPEGVTYTPKPYIGKRRVARGRRQYGNTALVEAYWAKDRLQATRSPNFVFVLSGYVTIPLADYRLQCGPGFGILTPAGIPHSDGAHLCLDTSIPGNLGCDLLSLRPYNGGLDCWISHTHHDEHYSHRQADECARIPNADLTFYLETLTNEMAACPPQYQEIGIGVLSSFAHLLYRELKQTPHLQVGMPQLLDSTEDGLLMEDPIAIAQKYIRNHLSQALTLELVARQVYMSRRNFTDKFREKTGQSFLEYLNVCRFNRACQLLENGDWSVESVAKFVGLKPNRLRTLFLEKAGVSPSDYRRTKMPE